MHLPRSIRLFGALAIASIVACGDTAVTTEPTDTTADDGSPAAAQVAMVSSGDGYGGETHSFSPSSVTIQQAGGVTWSNSSGNIHNVTFVAAAGAPANIGDMSSGSASRTFNASGTFGYECTNHPGMTGQVVVEASTD